MKLRYFSGFIDESLWPACPSGFRCIVVKVGRKWVYGKEARVYPLNFKRIRRSVWDNCLKTITSYRNKETKVSK